MAEKIISDFDPKATLPLEPIHLSQKRAQNPDEVSLDKELSARIHEVFQEAVKVPESISSALEKRDDFTAFNRVVSKGDSPSLELLNSFTQPKEKVEQIAEEILEEKTKLEKRQDVSLALLFINLYARYYENVHIPRVSSLILSAHKKNDEIKDLNTLIGHLNRATPDAKTGKIDLSEHKELIDRIKEQDGVSLLDESGSWESKVKVEKQIEEINAFVREGTNKVNELLRDVSHEKETMGRFFEPTKNATEVEDRFLGRIAQRTGT